MINKAQINCNFCKEEFESRIDLGRHICMKPKAKWKTQARPTTYTISQAETKKHQMIIREKKLARKQPS